VLCLQDTPSSSRDAINLIVTPVAPFCLAHVDRIRGCAQGEPRRRWCMAARAK